MGAFVVTQVFNQGVTANGKRSCDAILAGSGTYATGGDTIPLTSLPIKSVEEVYTTALSSGVIGLLGAPGYNVMVAGTADAPKLVVVDANGVEIANATNLSTRQSFQVRLVGH